MFRFEIIYKSKRSAARVGRIHTPHGIIDTPNFVPVGTHATLKAIDSCMVNQLDVQLMFCNTYHLLLHPGPEVIENAGGLHRFMNRNQPIITDSGGFQVFSLASGVVNDEMKSRGQNRNEGSVVKVSEEGVVFRSYRDGAKITLTPESAVQIQKSLGADIIIPLDELLPHHVNEKKLKKSFDRTHRWEKRSLEEHLRNPKQQAMYAVIHGGIDADLRRQSCEILTQLPFDGFGIGGSLGRNREEMVEMLKMMTPFLPTDKPNHLLGIGDLASIEACIPLGIDTFDSSYPTRSARHAVLLSQQGQVKVDQNRYKSCLEPIEHDCCCYTCKNYTLAYIHHLFKAKETVGLTLATIHNVHYMMKLMKQYRNQILSE
ncbi:MAG: tgt [Chlamydiales bacterium]|jgi:queuine tRNA-ribosyltransferase|nr:tgt [Chlamydiales bacterium]